MVSEYAVRNLLISCVDNLNTIERGFDCFYECYSNVLDETASRNRYEVCRCLNAACIFNMMARQWYSTGDTVRARRCLNDAFNCLERATYVN